jgi:hypothetical protein
VSYLSSAPWGEQQAIEGPVLMYVSRAPIFCSSQTRRKVKPRQRMNKKGVLLVQRLDDDKVCESRVPIAAN